MAYAITTPELKAIESDEDVVTDALEAASGIMDSYLVLYETPVLFSTFVFDPEVEEEAADAAALVQLQARFKRWCVALAAGILTANQPASEKTVKDYQQAIDELTRVRAGFDPLPLLTMKDAPVLTRAW